MAADSVLPVVAFLSKSPIVVRLRALLEGEDMPVFLVGGAVRDAVLATPNKDLDLAVPEGGIRLAFRLADELGLPAYALDDERDVGRIILPDSHTTIDIARFRGPDLAADLRGRDFTINALAMPLLASDNSDLIDLFGGLADLEMRQVRVIHARSIEDDPIRALRAVRFGEQLGFALSNGTLAAARQAVPQLDRVSQERIREELTKIIRLQRPQVALRQMADLGQMSAIMPEIAQLAGVAQSPPHFEPVLDHTFRLLGYLVEIESLIGEAGEIQDWRVQVEAAVGPYRGALADHLTRRVDGDVDGTLLLRLGAIWHDAGKRPTQTVEPGGRIRFFGHDDVGAVIAGRRLRRLTFSAEAVGHVQAIVRGHMRPLLLAAGSQMPSRRAIYRYFRDLGPVGLDVGLVSLADHLATYDGQGDSARWQHLVAIVGRLYAAYFTEHAQVIAPQRLLTGSELIAELELAPGPEVGRLLRIIEEAQATGDVQTREQAIALARLRRGAGAK